MSIEYIDFWCMAIDKQPRLVDELWTAPDSSLLVEYFN